MLEILCVLVLIFVIMGVVGIIVKGLFWLFVLAIALFVVSVLFAVVRTALGRRRRRRTLGR